jgi:DNA-binding transcriptional LysR family regulator
VTLRSADSLRFIEAIARAGSIRSASESLAITSTALNRRLLALEAELGAPLFERLPRGVRLSTAGEILVHYIRTQAADLERVRGQIADLAGERRGRVAIACSQALLPYFLPAQIGAYRAAHPGVTFEVSRRDRDRAERALVDHEADLALVFEPVRLADVQVIATLPQPIHAVMRRGHPLSAKGVLRLGDLVGLPLGLPNHAFGVRALMDLAMARSAVRLQPAIEADSFEFLRHYPGHEDMVTFQIPIGLPPEGTDEAIVSRPVDARDLPPGLLMLAQLRGRALPVAAAKFARQLERALAELEPPP